MLGWLLIVAATAALFPLLTQVTAISQGQVETPAADPAVYRISAANSLVSCSVPSTIVLQTGATSTEPYFSCTNNYSSSVTLNWSVQDDGGGGFLSASSSDMLSADGIAACRSVSLTAGTTEETRTVVFRGVTSASAGFYVELYFTGQVTVQASATGLGGGCP